MHRHTHIHTTTVVFLLILSVANQVIVSTESRADFPNESESQSVDKTVSCESCHIWDKEPVFWKC